MQLISIRGHKIMGKFTEKLKPKSKKLAQKQVTQETLEDHREAVLSKGRKLKAQMTQLQKRIVLVAAGIAALILVIVSVVGYLSLYVFQSTGDIAFRVTQVLPLPVASVDGEWVRYGDYLLVFRSSIRPVERQGGALENTEENQALINHYKNQAMNLAIRYTYARRLGNEIGVSVSREEIEEAIREYRTVDGKEWSDERFTQAIFENFGLSRREYERLVSLTLQLKKVTEAVDEDAQATAKAVQVALDGGARDFNALFDQIDGIVVEDSGSLVGSMDMDGGRAKVALGLEVGQVSGRFLSKNGDGYYFVKVTEKVEGAVAYSSIFIPFTEFAERMDEHEAEGRIKMFITLVTE